MPPLLPWGAPQQITGSLVLNQRFPGQWFQLESGLHYNWHRHYDPSLGRYTQPDPLGFVDGPGVYGYALLSPLVFLDIFGLQVGPPVPPAMGPGNWSWSPDSGNSRGGSWRDGAGRSLSWDSDGHWDMDDGRGNRQRFDRWGNPITADQAHSRHDKPIWNWDKKKVQCPPRPGAAGGGGFGGPKFPSTRAPWKGNIY